MIVYFVVFVFGCGRIWNMVCGLVDVVVLLVVLFVSGVI